MMNSIRPRQDYIDEISGLLIIAMVLIHIASRCNYDNTILIRAFFFFMPWFYFKSGFFYKQALLKGVVKKGVKKLLKPFVFFTVIAVVLDFLFSQDRLVFVDNIKVMFFCGTAKSNIPLWFLMSLFVVQIVSIFVLKSKSSNLGGAILLLICFTSIVGYCLQQIELKLPEYLAYNVLGTGFYLSGFMYNKYRETGFHKYLLLVASVLLFFNYLILPSFIHIKSNRHECGNYFLWIYSSISACIVLMYVWNYFRIKVPALRYVGRHAMLILCSHWIVINVLDVVFGDDFDISARFVLYVILVGIIEIMLCRFEKELKLEKLF